MNKNTNVGSMTRGFVAFCAAFIALFSHAAEVTNVNVTTHYPWNGKADVTYEVRGIESNSTYLVQASVIVDANDPGKNYPLAYTNLVASAEEGREQRFTLDFAQLTNAGGGTFVGRSTNVVVAFTVAEPNYAVIDLSAGAMATSYPVTYLVDAGDYANNDEYKTDKLLLKRVGANYVGVFETTQKQYEHVMGVLSDGVNKTAYFSQNTDKALEAKRPIERISYQVLVQNGGFFTNLVDRTHLPLALPTGDEWEAAARGNMTVESGKKYNLGAGNYWVITGTAATDNQWLPLMGRYIDLWNGTTKVANGNNNASRTSNGKKGTAVVGSYKANDNGLYDMHGNVSEWTTEESGTGSHYVRGGSWQDSAANCAIDVKRASADADVSQVYRTGFRVFGDALKIENAFVHKTGARKVFTLDIDSDNVRQVRVADNAGNYTFFYTPEGGSEINWVQFDDPALFGGTGWQPSHAGINTATNAADYAVTAMFKVDALAPVVTASATNVVYDGSLHTIVGPDVSAPEEREDATIVYWCADLPEHTTEETATRTKPWFRDVKYKNEQVSDYIIRYKVTSPFYDAVYGSKALRINPRSIETAVVTLEHGNTNSLTYNARLQTNAVLSVTVSNLTLVANQDYTVLNNYGTDAKGYTAEFYGKGNFTGTKTEVWNILPLDFGNIDPEGGSGTQERKAARINLFSEEFERRYGHPLVYNGHPQTNYVISVSINGVDFEPTSGSFSNVTGNVQTEAGTYQVVVAGSLNFKGELTNSWTIAKLPITNATVWTDAPLEYNGNCQTQAVTNVTVVAPGYEISANLPAIPETIIVPDHLLTVPANNYRVWGNVGTNASAKVGPYTIGVRTKSSSRNFCDNVFTNWFIGQRDLTNAVFTITNNLEYYVFDRTGKMPGAKAEDKDDAPGRAIHPMITEFVDAPEPDWAISNYLDNVNVGDAAKIVFAATTNGNYRGVVMNDFETGVQPDCITSVTIKPEAESFVWDGWPKTIAVTNVEVTSATAGEVFTNEYAMASNFTATASGIYTVTVRPLTANFTNAVPAASDTWTIVPAAPVLTWTTGKGAQFVTNENGTVLFGVSDLTVSANARCGNEKIIYAFDTYGNSPVVSGDKFHVTKRTTITARSTWTDPVTHAVLTGAVTTVTLAPGQCADPEIFIGTPGTTNFNRNATCVTIRPSALVTVPPATTGTNVTLTTSDPYWPAWKRSTGTIHYWLLDASTNVIAAAGTNTFALSEKVWACTNLTVSADTVFVVAQICDTNYVDSIVKTQQLTRVFDNQLKAPTITIEKIDAKTRRVTVTNTAATAALYYTTSNKVVNAESPEWPEAEKPTADCELGDEWAASKAATTKYEGPFLVTLSAVDECVDVKAIAYTLVGESDFSDRSPVADAKDFREWHEGEALDAPDQTFTNGWTQIQVPNVENPNPHEAYPLGNVDTPWVVAFTNNDPNAEGAVGKDCMRSGVLTNSNQLTSSISTKVTGAGYVTFRWKAHCEDDPNEDPTWDHGEFIVDGIVTQKIDGVTDWMPVAISLTNGVHTLTWRYVKDFSKHGVDPTTRKEFAEGEDCVYLDNFNFVQAWSFGDFQVTVDPLVYNTKFQLPTNEVLASGKTTNYIHTVKVLDPSKWPSGTAELEEGRDYTVVTNEVSTPGCDAGVYTVTLKACEGSYLVKGTTNVTWTILPLDLTGGELTLDKTSPEYDGSITTTVTDLQAKHYRDDLVDVFDQKDSWSPATMTTNAVGTFTYTVTGFKNLTGSVSTTWSITKKPLTADMVALAWTRGKYYNRQAQAPGVTVTATAPAEITTNDYTVTYLSEDYSTDITNAGTKVAIVAATATGNWSGAITNTYAIWRAVVDTLELDGSTSMPYCGDTCTVDGTAKMAKGSRPKMTLNEKEWQITGNSAVDAGTYTASVQIVDTVNFKYVDDDPAKAPIATWTITPIDLSKADLKLKPPTYTFEYNGTNQFVKRADVTSATVDNLSLTTFDVTCTPQVVVGTYPFTVISTDKNFSGAKDYEWKIVERSITNAVITLAETNLVWNGSSKFAYDGSKLVRTNHVDATEQAIDFTVTDKLPDGTVTNLVLHTDYEIVDNSDKGTNAANYTLTLRGTGNYFSKDTTISTNWVIYPSLPVLYPNNEDSSTNEIKVVTKGTRVLMGRDVDTWTMYRRVIEMPACKTSNWIKVRSSAAAVTTVDARRIVEVYDVTPDCVTSAVRVVDYRIGTNVNPVVVLAYTNNVPKLDEFGHALTNEVGCVITNFFHNGQLVAMTRGNVVVSNIAEGVYQPFTNDVDNAIYTDGTLRYTIDGTEPTVESAAWTAETRLAITNTTTILAKVFGDQGTDSATVTNVFVRENDAYAAPIVQYTNEQVAAWTTATNGETVLFKVLGLPVVVANTNQVSIVDPTCKIWCQTNDATAQFEYPAEGFAFSNSVKLISWIADANGEYAASPAVTNWFTLDDQLSQPVIAFSNATQVIAKDATTFTNAWQWIAITRVGNTFTKDTDGEIYFKTNATDAFVKYVGPFAIWTNATVWAVATNSVYGLSASSVTNVAFSQAVAPIAAPTITVKPTKTVKQVEFTITRNAGNIVYFTTNGTAAVGLNPGDKNGIAFTGDSTNIVLDITENATKIVQAIAYTEVLEGTDFIGLSPMAVCQTNRASRIGDALRPGLDEQPGSTPSTADLEALSDYTKNDGNTMWKDSFDNWTNTNWVVDYDIAYTNDYGGITGGKSMRSGCVRSTFDPDGNPVFDGTNSVMTAKVYGPGLIRFYWKASTEFEPECYESYYDFCEFRVDGGEPVIIYGTNDWTLVEWLITETNETAQMHTLTWNYIKDEQDYEDEYLFGTDEFGEPLDHIEDCVWVDEFTWEAQPMLDQAVVTYAPLTYNQQPQQPVFTVSVAGQTLTEDVDYVVDVTAQTSAANDYTAVIKALGKTCTGSNVVTWAINPLSISNAVVTLSGGQMYTREYPSGKERYQYAVVESIKVGELELVNDTTWTADGTNETAVGTHTATITGRDNLTDNVSTNWVIAPRTLTDKMVTLKSGTAKNPIVYSGMGTNVSFYVHYGHKSKWLVEGDDYEVVPGSDIATNAGNYQLIVNGLGNYAGSVTQDWSIAKFDFDSHATELVLSPTNFVYDATPHTAAVVRVEAVHPYFGNIAFSNEAWVVSNNVETAAGEYWAKLYPLDSGNFTGGPISNKWEILPTSIDIKDVIVVLGPTNTYNGSQQWQTIQSVTHPKLGLLAPGVDYKYPYCEDANRTPAGKYTLKVEGIGNYTGKKSVDFQLLPAEIDSITIDPASYVYDKAEKTLTPDVNIIVKAGGLTAVANTDYTATGDLNGTAASNYTVTIKGSYKPETVSGCTGNFKVPTDDLTTNVTWQILHRDISNEVTVAQSSDSFVYNREEQKPVVTVTCGQQTFVLDEDYTIEWPENCTDASNLTYYVCGKGSVTNKYEMHYAITPATITSLKFQAQPGKPWTCPYDGQAHTPKVAYVKASTTGQLNDLTLSTSEYKLTNVGQTEVGTYASEVKSTSRNFTDAAEALVGKWQITPKDISDAEVVVELKKPIVYTGGEQKIEEGNIQKITVKSGSLEVKGVSLICPTHIDAGDYNDAYVTATDPNFTGTAKVQWSIAQRDITDATAIVWTDDRPLWSGDAQTPTVQTLTVGGPDLEAGQTLEFPGTLATLLADDGDKTEAGAYTSTVTGSKNFKGTTTISQPWAIVPRPPAITPNDGTGKYSKIADYITVEINNDRDDQLWKLCYTTNDWADTMIYPHKGWKFDIERHTLVQAFAVSCDGAVTGATSRCEYFFGKQNVTPTIALTAKAGAEKGRPTSWMQDGRETIVTGAAEIVTFKNAGGVVTNFFHKETRVALTRFGGMTQAEIDALVERETIGGLCPYTDGEIWYTVAENGAPVVDPTNVTGYTSHKFDKNDVTTWPLISTNAVIVARVFGDQLESSATVTNTFCRLWTTVAQPTIDPASGSFQFSLDVTMATNHAANADWTFTNGVEALYYTLDDSEPTTASTLYTNGFSVTWADMLPGTTQVVVKAIAYAGDDVINLGSVSATYDHFRGAFAQPTLTPTADFPHALPDGFPFALTNHAPLGVGGVMMYSIDNGTPQSCGDVAEFGSSVKTTATIRVWVEATAAAHDYCNSTTNEATYTYTPYTMVAPVIDQLDQTFFTKDFEYTVRYPAKGAAEDADHIYDGGTVSYSTDGGKTWTAIPKTEMPKTFKTSETVTVMVKQTLEDHLDSDIVTRTYTRFVKVPEIKLVKADDTDFPIEITGGQTNYYHKAFVAMSCVGGDTHVEYTIVEEGQPEKKGTYRDKIAVSNTFTVTAIAKSTGGTESAPVTATYTRQWETLVQADISLITPQGAASEKFRNTGDRLAITNNESQAKGHAVLWPTNVVIQYAVYSNSIDTVTEPTNWTPFVQGVTTNFFKADSNAVFVTVSAEDYLPATNATYFIRLLGEVGEPTIALDNSTSRTNVTVTITPPAGTGVAVYYTFAFTNVAEGVEEPVGSEYDVTKASSRYTDPFDIALKPDQTLIVKARAYVEDDSSALVGVAETNFTARGAVVADAITLPWTMGDALDAPDQEFIAYDTVRREENTTCREDVKVFTTGGSSMVFTNLVDNEIVTIMTEVQGSGTVIFDWKTRCEKGQHGFNRDHFAFSVDGVEVMCLDGDSGWQTVTNYIHGLAEAKHTLAWSYKKDASERMLDDSAWLDHFRWIESKDRVAVTDDMTDWARDVFGEEYVDMVLSPGGVADAEEWTAALAFTAANGRSYYDCYVLGLDVDDVESEFSAGEPQLDYIEDLEGHRVLKSVTITWTPCTKAGRTYTLLGKKDLATEIAWAILATQNATADDNEGGSITASMLNESFKDYKFFQLRVRMTE